MCKDGNAIYYPSQQWAGPPGTCQLHRCIKLIDGIVAMSTQRWVNIWDYSEFRRLFKTNLIQYTVREFIGWSLICLMLLELQHNLESFRCPEQKLQGVSKTGSCQISGIDRNKMYPQCCPTISCTRVVGRQAPCNSKQINVIEPEGDDYLDLVLN